MTNDNNKRVYLTIGSCRCLDVQVCLDDEIVYDGLIEKAPEEIKQLKYSNIEVSNKMIFKVYSKLQ